VSGRPASPPSEQAEPVALVVEVAEQGRRWHRNGQPIRFRFDAEGVGCDGPAGETRDAWSLFTGYRATAHGYELMVGRRRRFVIPRTALTGEAGGPAVERALAGVLSAHLPLR
jgi:hypothetical protein